MGGPPLHCTERRKKKDNSPSSRKEASLPAAHVGGEAKKGVEQAIRADSPQTKASLCGWDVKKGVRRKRDRTARAWLPHTERVALAGSQQKEERMGSGDDMEYLLFAAAMRVAVMCWGSTRHCVVGMRECGERAWVVGKPQ